MRFSTGFTANALQLNNIRLCSKVSFNSNVHVLFPLIFSKMIKKVDIEAHVTKYSGEIAVAGGIRYGISHCLANFVDENMKEKMRLAGLLQIDYRTRERKKAGQWGARRKFTWKKR